MPNETEGAVPCHLAIPLPGVFPRENETWTPGDTKRNSAMGNTEKNQPHCLQIENYRKGGLHHVVVSSWNE